jgi:curli production assembly/transport component CsgG
MKRLLYLLIISSFSLIVGCSTIPLDPPEVQPKIFIEELDNITPPKMKVPIAVYSFTDMTGQRKPSENMSLISTAVTQGGHIWLIQSLKNAGNGEWFQVVERGALANLIKERQIIRQTRETYGDEDIIKPLLFAGVLIEGGIVGYDTNTQTGGLGARMLGIGASSQFREDTVSIGIRLISVNTGEVLLAISTEKTIWSAQQSATVFKFLDAGTKLLETEVGYTENESSTYAVRKAIDAAVMELIYEGERKGLWEFKIVHTVPHKPCDYGLPKILQREHCKKQIIDYENGQRR